MTIAQFVAANNAQPHLRLLKSTAPNSFRHPLDERAHQAVEKIPIFHTASRALLDVTFERSQRMLHMSSSIRVSRKQFPRIYEAFSVASYLLNAPEIEVYVSSDPSINAYAIGQTRPMIVLTSGAVDVLTEPELVFLLGHEIGHIKCGHMISHYVLNHLASFLRHKTNEIIDFGLELALLNVSRMSELSADRAGLLTVQDEKVAIKALAQLACGSRKLAEQIDLEELMHQAREFQATGTNLVDNFHKTTLLAGSTHPYIIMRVQEILSWAGTSLEKNLGDYVNSTEVTYLE